MLGTLFSTPRSRAGSSPARCRRNARDRLLLPVIALVGWSIEGWGLAALLWIGLHGLDLVLARVRRQGNGRANSGVQAFGLFFKIIAILVVLFAALAADRDVALAAAVTYGLAYTFELGLSLATYFGTPA